jgi:hypothetical protein
MWFTPTPNTVEAKRTLTLNFTGSNREQRKLFRSIRTIGIEFLPKMEARANLIGPPKLLAGTSTDPLMASNQFHGLYNLLTASIIILTAPIIILTASKSTLTASTVTLTASASKNHYHSLYKPFHASTMTISGFLQAPLRPLQSLSRPL